MSIIYLMSLGLDSEMELNINLLQIGDNYEFRKIN